MNCQLTIILVTYNHEKFIQRALNSLFSQVVKAPIELIVADDCSTDNTLEIIRKFVGVDERFNFTFLNNTVNLGITRNYQRGFAACTGEYVAVLEGDDYWSSPFKLQRQYEFLESHWECDLCSVNYFVYDENNSEFKVRTSIGDGHRLLSARDLIADNLVGNFSTCMYRKSALDSLPQSLYEIKSYDWIINICIARHSLIGFLETPMSVYRLHSEGIWTQKSLTSKLEEQLEMLPAYDSLTGYKFHNEFNLLESKIKNNLSMAYSINVIGVFTKTIMLVKNNLPDYLPPVLVTLARLIIPPAFKNLFVKLLKRDGSV